MFVEHPELHFGSTDNTVVLAVFTAGVWNPADWSQSPHQLITTNKRSVSRAKTSAWVQIPRRWTVIEPLTANGKLPSPESLIPDGNLDDLQNQYPVVPSPTSTHYSPSLNPFANPWCLTDCTRTLRWKRRSTNYCYT